MREWKKCFLQEELEDNEKLGLQIGKQLKLFGTVSQVEKYESHIKDIEKIVALGFCLSTRLDRVVREIVERRNIDDQCELEMKKDKLIHQIEESKLIDSFISKRTIKLSVIIRNYLDDLAGEQFEQFVNNKIKLSEGIKDVEEKLKTT